MDGSSQNRSGVGFILITPEGVPLHYALQLLSKILNNEVEYKAFITCLNLAKALGA